MRSEVKRMMGYAVMGYTSRRLAFSYDIAKDAIAVKLSEN